MDEQTLREKIEKEAAMFARFEYRLWQVQANIQMSFSRDFSFLFVYCRARDSRELLHPSKLVSQSVSAMMRIISEKDREERR